MNWSTLLLNWSALIAGSLALFMGCASNDEPAIASYATNAPTQAMSSNEIDKANDLIASAMSEGARKRFEDMRHGIPTPPSEFPFPNVEGYAHHPRPDYINFYAVDDHYPDYLQVEYDVDKKNYNPSEELKWFKASLKQIRRYGPTKFPPIKWIAIVICNIAEHKDASTFEQSFKVGAIFKAEDVLNSSRSLSELVAHAEMDRHPFQYDRKQPTPGKQQRWLIVEHHAATKSSSE